MSRDQLRQWHRLFGIALTDLFSDSPWRVELEKELALQSQLLDVVIIERTGGGTADPAALGLPDGLEGLRSHNLLVGKAVAAPPPPRCREGVDSPYLPAYPFQVPGGPAEIAPSGG